MRANHAEVSWDATKKKWVVRIKAGEEVMRRYCDIPKDADEQKLRSVALKTVQDDGYEIDPTQITIQRESVVPS
jgi:hypothetical protein